MGILMSIDLAGLSFSLPSPLLLLLSLILALLLLYLVPKLQTYKIRTNKEPKGPLELENDFRQTLVQIFGGVAIIATVAAAIYNAQLARESIAQAEQSYELARQGQVADRTFKAMDLLSKQDNMDAKLAAIYALDAVAHEEPKSEWQITQTLFNYVEVHAAWSPSSSRHSPRAPPADIAAISDFLRNRPYYHAGDDGNWMEEHQRWDYDHKNRPSAQDIRGFWKEVNLPNVDLRHVFLDSAMLKSVNINDSHFDYAWLRRAHFDDAYGLQAHFPYADLSDSYWTFANLKDADLRGAQLCRGHFEHVYAEGADLSNADMENSHWNNSQQFRPSNLKNADLKCSLWTGADMQDLYLEGVRLFGADLRGAANLSRAQLEKAFGDQSTRLSDESLRPSNWRRDAQIQCPSVNSRPACP